MTDKEVLTEMLKRAGLTWSETVWSETVETADGSRFSLCGPAYQYTVEIIFTPDGALRLIDAYR